MGKKDQNKQNKAAAYELRILGVSEERIAELEEGWIEHAKNLGRCFPSNSKLNTNTLAAWRRQARHAADRSSAWRRRALQRSN